MFLNLITEILSRSTPQVFCCCYHRQSCKSKIYYIFKLLAELGLTNSKSKKYSKAANSIEEIIQTKIYYCKKFDLKITELDKLLPIMHWLPKIHIVTSYYCTTNPLSETKEVDCLTPKKVDSPTPKL